MHPLKDKDYARQLHINPPTHLLNAYPYYLHSKQWAFQYPLNKSNRSLAGKAILELFHASLPHVPPRIAHRVPGLIGVTGTLRPLGDPPFTHVIMLEAV